MIKTSLLSVVAVCALFACAGNSTSADGVPVASVSDAAPSPEITVYKSPTCGCCSLWVDHLEENGFAVDVVEMENLNAVRNYYDIPDELAACHTAVVDGYVVEGHVPADDIKRLLEERPEAIGISVPGMPIGSPGMEVEGRPAESYDVILVTEGGSSVFSSH